MRLNIAAVLRGTNARVLRLSGSGELTSGELSPADLERAIESVSIDSRTVTSGGLFVALSGERVDGHEYIEGALRAGALGCLVHHVPPAERLRAALTGESRYGDSRYLFLVRDSLEALQRLASYWRERHRAEVIGITGSVGKTTTKEIVAAVLARSRPVLKSEANLNTEIGLPLMLLRLAPEHTAAVLEMGMYARGDIELLATIARPRIGIVTNVAPVHLERMGTIERIGREKSRLVAALPADGLAILNGDDPWTRAMAETTGIAPSMLAGRAPDCHVRAARIMTHGLDGVSFTLCAEGHRMPVRTRVPGEHTVFAFLAAAAAGRRLGMEWREIREAMASVSLVTRQQVLQGPRDTLIIDDSYNAAPMSMNAALDLLRASSGTKIAVLGDMLELGEQQEEVAHRSVGERVAEVADWLVVRGPRSRWLAQAAERKGLPRSHVVEAESNAEAVAAVREIISEGNHPGTGGSGPTMQRASAGAQSERPSARWSVLVKGSRGMKMEEVVQGLRGEQ